jgi:hypothetical protein
MYGPAKDIFAYKTITTAKTTSTIFPDILYLARTENNYSP